MDTRERARIYSALGDEHRLAIVDELVLGDRTSRELADLTGLPGNLLAHHLGVLESAGIIGRRTSEGDQRRRYVTLRPERVASLLTHQHLAMTSVLFVCTHNSARSQFAAALWRHRTGLAAQSAGTHPAPQVDTKAIQVAAEHGVDLSGAKPRGYDAVAGVPDLVISVCDRARETDLPFAVEHRHWSVPDPVTKGTVAAFRTAFDEIAIRIDGLAGAIACRTRGDRP